MSTLTADYLSETSIRCGTIAVTHRTTVLALARKLIKVGYDPATILQTRWPKTGMLSLRGTLGAFAELTVEENDIRGPVFVRYRPNRYVARKAALLSS